MSDQASIAIIGRDIGILALIVLLIHVGKWWIAKRGQRTTEGRVYFVLLLVAIMLTGVSSTVAELNEIQELEKVELLNIKLNNAALQTQQLVKDVLKQGDTIVNQTKHPLFGKLLPVG